MNRTAATGSLLAAFTIAAPAPGAFERALEAYTNERYREAFEDLACLADCGHVGAAQLALLMLVHGSHLFGSRFDITPQRRATWLSTTAAVERANP